LIHRCDHEFHGVDRGGFAATAVIPDILRTFTILWTRHCLLCGVRRKIDALMSSLERIVARLASINRELAMLKLRLSREHARVLKGSTVRRTPTKRKSA
jgi:hypothetical protein